MSILLQTAKETIISALNDFDVDLGRRAAEILHNEDRLNIIEAAVPRTSMMACRPAGVSIADLKSMGMHMPDFEDRFAPDFIRQDNPENYAIIDYEYDGSEGSLKYLAHELGHAIADDMQREKGRSFRNYSLDNLEKQAYFVQKIVTHSMAQKEGRSDDAPLKESFERVRQMNDANTAFEQALTAAPEQRVRMIDDVLAGDAKLECLRSVILPKLRPTQRMP